MIMTGPFRGLANLQAIAHRYIWTAPLVAVLATGVGLLEGAGIGLLIPLLYTLADGATPMSGPMAVIGKFAQGEARDVRLLLICSFILALVLLKSLLQAVLNGFSSWIYGWIGHDIRLAISERLQKVGYGFHLREEPGRLMNVFGTESWKAADAVRAILYQISATVVATVFGVLLLIVSLRLALIVAAGGLVVRSVQKAFEKRQRRLSDAIVGANQVLADRMLFSILGARIVRLFNTGAFEHRRLTEASDRVRRAVLQVDRAGGATWPALEAMHGILFIGVLLAAVRLGTALPTLAAFLVLLNRLQPHLRTLEQSASAFASAAAELREVEWLIEPAGKPASPGGEARFEGVQEEVRFENVAFRYPTRDGAPALEEITFTLRKGGATALIGGSGSGKSTIVNLLCRLMEPTSGRILVDGAPLASLSPAAWLAEVAVAGQDVELIEGTIADNIAYGRSELDLAAVTAAARAAQAHFAFTLPRGLQTPVGPRGLAMSGGQRQRIGLARALARNPQLLILDEATNAVDVETESAFTDALKALPAHVILLVISHRHSTLSLCDHVVALAAGRVVEAGPPATHAALRAMALEQRGANGSPRRTAAPQQRGGAQG